MTDGQYHIPVLLKETLELLNIQKGKKYIDCTLGGGGHTGAILRTGGTVLALDQDQEAIENAKSSLLTTDYGKNLALKKGNFGKIGELAREAGFDKVSGILFDLGVSSHQLETDYRGFSFNKEGMLDMRMDRDLTVTAADLVNAGGEDELANLFWKFGEERWSKAIARKIVEMRRVKKIETTNELAEIIVSVKRRSQGDRMHPATRVFQALRIAVNSELENLEAALGQAFELLDVGGRLAVISFHSLEDRIIKNYFKNNEKLKILTDKPIVATEEEVALNPRARSGKLRVSERIS